MADTGSSPPLLRRLVRTGHAPVGFTLDGVAQSGRAGDSVLGAILTLGGHLRHSDFSASPRAGFCLMGACQDCWIWLEDGRRIRACSTALQPGMRLRTRAPDPAS